MNTTVKTLLSLIAGFFFLSCNSASAQSPVWGFSTGSIGSDDGNAVRKAPNGNVYVTGKLTGTVDLDPSAAVYNVTTNSGSEDIYLACYTSTGSFVWGFVVGGATYDAALNMAVDSNSNVIIGGYFRGQNVDFDPSVSGTAYLSDQGLGGGSMTFYGDGFVAKYSPAGAYVFAVDLGGSTIYDFTGSVGVDGAGNVYAGGAFTNTMDVDPSPAVYTLSSGNGKCYVVKYSSAGQLIWGKSFATPGYAATDSHPLGMEIRGAAFYITGVFQSTADFDPSAGVASLTASGIYDGFLAKYDTAGNYLFAVQQSGSGLDHMLDLCFDPAGDVYITGISNSSTVDFNGAAPGGVENAPPGSADHNIVIGKYTSSGTFIWGHITGGSGADFGRGIEASSTAVYCTGVFSNTVDFDPSSAITNLTSNGNQDIFISKYDTSGNFLCAFGVGDSGDDQGAQIALDTLDDIYATGVFLNNNVDFDPSAANFPLSSAGSLEAYLVKYSWTSGGTPATGSLVGDTICQGQQGYLTFNSTSGSGPYTITVNNGTSNITFNGVIPGVPFAVSPNPSGNTTYTLQSIQVLGTCGSLTNSNPGGSPATIVVNALPVANAGADTLVCSSIQYHLNGSGVGSYSWTPTATLNNPSIANPTILSTDTAISFILTVDNAGCTDADTVHVSVRPKPVANAGIDTAVCKNVVYQLNGSGNGSYLWTPNGALNDPTLPNPVFNANNPTLFSLEVTTVYGCKDTDQVQIGVHPLPVADAGNDTAVCSAASFQLHGSGGVSYSWSPATGLTGANTANPTGQLTAPATFQLLVTNAFGCQDSDAVSVSVLPEPTFNVTPGNVNLCNEDTVILTASGGDIYSWTGPGILDPSSAEAVIFGSVDTVYTVAITSLQCNITDTLSVDVTMYPAPEISISKSSDLDCAHASVELSAQGGFQYIWSPATGLDNTATGHPIATPTVSTWYTVEGTDLYGCKGKDSIEVIVAFNGGGTLLFPTAFTPNNDQHNDCFKVLSSFALTSYELHIFNRWGQQVFSTTSAGDCWDGWFNGGQQDVGTFYYYYSAKTAACGDLSGKGDVHLIR
jgi:gliding motility-associated-like protein